MLELTGIAGRAAPGEIVHDGGQQEQQQEGTQPASKFAGSLQLAARCFHRCGGFPGDIEATELILLLLLDILLARGVAVLRGLFVVVHGSGNTAAVATALLGVCHWGSSQIRDGLGHRSAESFGDALANGVCVHLALSFGADLDALGGCGGAGCGGATEVVAAVRRACVE